MDYDTEADRLRRRYDEAVGWALQYGIKVYETGGQMKCLGALEDEIRAHEGKPESFERTLLGVMLRADERTPQRD